NESCSTADRRSDERPRGLALQSVSLPRSLSAAAASCIGTMRNAGRLRYSTVNCAPLRTRSTICGKRARNSLAWIVVFKSSRSSVQVRLGNLRRQDRSLPKQQFSLRGKKGLRVRAPGGDRGGQNENCCSPNLSRLFRCGFWQETRNPVARGRRQVSVGLASQQFVELIEGAIGHHLVIRERRLQLDLAIRRWRRDPSRCAAWGGGARTPSEIEQSPNHHCRRAERRHCHPPI